MRNLFLILASLGSIGSMAAYKAPVTVDWQVGDKNDKGGRTNTVTIINNSADTIRAPWSMYYGYMAGALASDTQGFFHEQVAGTNHRIFTDETKSIAPGKSVSIQLHGWYNHLKSFFPENPYIIPSSAKGGHGEPLRAELNYKEADHREMAREIEEYPDGERMYAHNERLKAKTLPGIYDIIPSFKSVSVDKKGSACDFTGKVTVKAGKGLENDRRIFSEMLRRQGVLVGEGGVPVTLNLDAKGIKGEGYRIKIGKNGIEVYGATEDGVFNGCASVLAILAGQQFPVRLPAAEIKDEPDFGYRGLHFDVARNFTSKDNVLKVLDMMALYKLNKLHFHIVDDEGWRIDIDGLPELTEIGSRRLHNDFGTALIPFYASGFDGSRTGNGYYTRQDFIDILKYAADRHIEVIPEIDMPGHSRAAIDAMNYRYNRYKDTDPEKATEYLLADFNDQSVYRGAQEYSDNVMCIALPSAQKFCNKVIDELIGMYDEAGLRLNTIHVGGDEVPEGAWIGSPICQEYMKANGIKDARGLRDDFLYKTYQYLKPKGVRIAGWQEILTEADGKTPNKTLPGHEMLSYMWSTQPYNDMDQTTYALVNAGFPVVLCNVNNLYLDLAYGKNVQEPGLTWGGYVDEYAPLATQPYDIYSSTRNVDHPEAWEVNLSDGKIQLDAAARKNIQGIQGQLWAESFRDFDMVQNRMMPKMFGVAERAWNAEPDWAKKDYEDFREAAARYAARTGENEFARLAQLGMTFHVGAPGLKIENGKLYANTPYPNGEVHYTVDGSEPTMDSPVWTAPVAVPTGDVIKAITVVNGHPSYITELFR